MHRSTVILLAGLILLAVGSVGCLADDEPQCSGDVYWRCQCSSCGGVVSFQHVGPCDLEDPEEFIGQECGKAMKAAGCGAGTCSCFDCVESD